MLKITSLLNRKCSVWGFFLLISAPFCFLPITHTETLRGQANTLDRDTANGRGPYNWSTALQNKGFGQKIKKSSFDKAVKPGCRLWLIFLADLIVVIPKIGIASDVGLPKHLNLNVSL